MRLFILAVLAVVLLSGCAESLKSVLAPERYALEQEQKEGIITLHNHIDETGFRSGR